MCGTCWLIDLPINREVESTEERGDAGRDEKKEEGEWGRDAGGLERGRVGSSRSEKRAGTWSL